MDPVTLNTGVPASQQEFGRHARTDAPVGHPTHLQDGREDLVQPRHGFAERDQEPNTSLGRHPVNTFAPPSSTLDQPREPVDTVPQQGSTQPNDGSKVHHTGTGTTTVPFKERVVGVAQKTRGTLLGKPELKEHGQAILDGRTTHEQDRHL